VVVPGGRALLARRQPDDGAAGTGLAADTELVEAVAPDPVDDPELPQAASPMRAAAATAMVTSRRVTPGPSAREWVAVDATGAARRAGGVGRRGGDGMRRT
jgi:hypothetical protein